MEENEQDNQPQRFYFNGLFYKTEEELFQASRHFVRSEISPVSAERILLEWSKTVSLNLFNNHIVNTASKNICNGQLQQICENCLMYFIRQYLEEVKKIHDW